MYPRAEGHMTGQVSHFQATKLNMHSPVARKPWTEGPRSLQQTHFLVPLMPYSSSWKARYPRSECLRPMRNHILGRRKCRTVAQMKLVTLEWYTYHNTAGNATWWNMLRGSQVLFIQVSWDPRLSYVVHTGHFDALKMPFLRVMRPWAQGYLASSEKLYRSQVSWDPQPIGIYHQQKKGPKKFLNFQNFTCWLVASVHIGRDDVSEILHWFHCQPVRHFGHQGLESGGPYWTFLCPENAILSCFETLSSRVHNF